MFIKVCNTKNKELANISKSSKRDVHNHGIGVSSIESIVKKYDGYVEFADKGEKFEVDVSLYGMISWKSEFIECYLIIDMYDLLRQSM